jgi:hypothetical protein
MKKILNFLKSDYFFPVLGVVGGIVLWAFALKVLAGVALGLAVGDIVGTFRNKDN